MNEHEYNGWTNYQTWTVNLELFDGVDFREYFEMKPDREEFAEFLKNLAEEFLSCFDEPVVTESVAFSFAMRYIGPVNWREIAEHHFDQFENYCDECQKQYDETEIRNWKYEPSYRYCDDCYTEKLDNDERNER